MALYIKPELNIVKRSLNPNFIKIKYFNFTVN